jgi:hypothetical protein
MPVQELVYDFFIKSIATRVIFLLEGRDRHDVEEAGGAAT